MKALDIILIEMVVSVIPVVHSMGIFFYEVENSVVSLVSVPQRDSFILKRPENGSHQARWNGLNMTDLCERKK